MKTKIYSLLAVAISSVIAISCSSDNAVTNDPVAGETTSLSVKLEGTPSKSKAIGAPTQEEENTVGTFTVFVFNANSLILEKQQTFPSALLGEVTGLTTGAKKVVVLANATVGSITTYDGLKAEMIDLDGEELASNLSMSGEGTTTLQASITNTLTVNLYRVVAKIQLGTITIAPAAGHDQDKFTIDSVYIMKAVDKSTLGIGEANLQVNGIGSNYYGGVTDAVSTTKKDYLAVHYPMIDNDSDQHCYFYVFPNDNTDNNATLITLVCTYDGQQMYYPFRIGAGSNYEIKRNEIHTINVTMKQLANGTSTPETTVDPTTLEVTVVPQDWGLELEQNVEW